MITALKRRAAGWSLRRRYVVFVVVPALVFCCGGTAVGVPLALLARVTTEAGRGAPAPDAAASEYLMALGYGQEDGLLPLLDDERQEELLSQWRAYRSAMQHTDPPASRLDFGSLDVGPVVNGRAEVTTAVSASWWSSSGGTAFNSEELGWRFETHEDDGWRIAVVHAPAWCGGYVLASRC